MRSKSTLLLLSLISTACATQGTHTQSASAAPAKVFVADVSAAPQTNLDKGECHSSKNKMDRMDWKEMLALANSCVLAKKWKPAEEVAQEIARRDTNSPWGPYFLALVAENDGKFERSVWMIDQAVRRAPEVGLFHYQKGRLLWKKSENAGASAEMLKSVQLDPNLIDAHLFLGQVFFRDQDFARAARHFQAVLKARPKDPTALMGLAECQVQSGDARGALEIFERGNSYYSSEPTFLLRQAYVYEVVLNEVDKAIELYKSVATGYEKGVYKRTLDFSLSQKIRDLEMSARASRAVAGSESHKGVAK